MTFNPKAGTLIYPLLTERAEVASFMAQILSMWTEMESEMAQVLGKMADTDAHTAMIIYTAVSNEGAQKAMLQGLARNKLKQADLEALESILSEIRDVGTDRNKIAHGVWGISDDYEDAVFYSNPRDFLLVLSEIHSAFQRGENKKVDELNKKWPNPIGYKKEDFIKISAEIMNLIGKINNFKSDLILK